MATAFGDLKTKHLVCTIEDGVGCIWMSRPPVNAIDLSMLEELTQAVQAARFDPAVGAVLIGSRIKGYFCAGLDIRELQDASPERSDLLDHLFKDVLFRGMRTARKIFVSLIDGHCLGGGLELALATDMRLGVQGPWQIGSPEVRLGGMPGGGAIQMLSRLIGPSRTLKITLFGEAIGMERAVEWGLVDAAFQPDESDRETRAFMKKLAEGPRQAAGAIKLALWEGQEVSPSHGFVLERELYRAIMMGEDLREGVAAFREKRSPQFKGK
jgi:enoyl-CoA hydratase/carnithine racemase